MSFAGYDVGDAWGAPEPATSGDIVADAMRKEKIIKSVNVLAISEPSLTAFFGFREIQAAQQDLQGIPYMLPVSFCWN